MTNVLVTGGAGYIGSHACKALAAVGFTPVTYDNLERGHAYAVKWGPLIQGDLTDSAALDYAFATYRPTAVMHFAAYSYVGESISFPLFYYHNNVLGALSLLNAMNKAGVDRLIFSSTCAIYGAGRQIPITEEHPQDPISPYGASKLMAERMILDAETAHGIRAVILRYFNAAGADPDGEIGENHAPETHLIPCVIDAALGKTTQFTLNGNDYDTPDGSCIRDYVHVSDLANAHLLALNYLQNNGRTVALNLGNGVGFSNRQIIETVQQVSGQIVPVRIGPRRSGDPSVLISDARRAKTILGWRPHRSALEQQITDAWRWRTKYIAK